MSRETSCLGRWHCGKCSESGRGSYYTGRMQLRGAYRRLCRFYGCLVHVRGVYREILHRSQFLFCEALLNLGTYLRGWDHHHKPSCTQERQWCRYTFLDGSAVSMCQKRYQGMGNKSEFLPLQCSSLPQQVEAWDAMLEASECPSQHAPFSWLWMPS
jgi:hypothetical protein